MKISYCVTCHNRLWQLKLTIDHNLKYTKVNESNICIIAYNDDNVESYLMDNYPEYIKDGRLFIKSHNEDVVFKDGSRWSCGVVKNLSHNLGNGDILFNLDADNFIDNNTHKILLHLGERDLAMINPDHGSPDGRAGRIGVSKKLFNKIGGYADDGRYDDYNFILKCLKYGVNVKYLICEFPPIQNEELK